MSSYEIKEISTSLGKRKKWGEQQPSLRAEFVSFNDTEEATAGPLNQSTKTTRVIIKIDVTGNYQDAVDLLKHFANLELTEEKVALVKTIIRTELTKEQIDAIASVGLMT